MKIAILPAIERELEVLVEVLCDEGHRAWFVGALPRPGDVPGWPAGTAADVVIVLAGPSLADGLQMTDRLHAEVPGIGCLVLTTDTTAAPDDRSELPEILRMPFELEALLAAVERAGARPRPHRH